MTKAFTTPDAFDLPFISTDRATSIARFTSQPAECLHSADGAVCAPAPIEVSDRIAKLAAELHDARQLRCAILTRQLSGKTPAQLN